MVSVFLRVRVGSIFYSARAPRIPRCRRVHTRDHRRRVDRAPGNALHRTRRLAAHKIRRVGRCRFHDACHGRFAATTNDGRGDLAGELSALQFQQRWMAARLAPVGTDCRHGVGGRFRALLAASRVSSVHAAVAASRSASLAGCSLHAQCGTLPSLRESVALYARHRALPAPGRGF